MRYQNLTWKQRKSCAEIEKRNKKILFVVYAVIIVVALFIGTLDFVIV